MELEPPAYGKQNKRSSALEFRAIDSIHLLSVLLDARILALMIRCEEGRSFILMQLLRFSRRRGGLDNSLLIRLYSKPCRSNAANSGGGIFMSLSAALLPEFDREMDSTRKTLER